MVQQQGGILGLLHVELEEGLRAKGRIGRHGDAVVLRQLDQTWLRQVGMMFDLQRRGHHLGVTEKVQNQLAVEIADADALGQPLVDQCLHGRPGLLNCRLARDHFLAIVGEARRITDRGVDVLEGDGEMHNVEIEVVDAPVLELFLANGLHAFLVMERVPQLGDEEEVGAFHNAFFDGPSHSLPGFALVAVIFWAISCDLLTVAEPEVSRTTCTVEKTISRFNGIVDLVGTRVIVDLPESDQDQEVSLHLLLEWPSATHPKPTSGISCPLLSLTVGAVMFAFDLTMIEIERRNHKKFRCYQESEKYEGNGGLDL